MARNKNAKIQMEAGRTLVSWEMMTDSGDAQNFNPSAAVMSGKDGFAPEIRPNGIVTGSNLVVVAVSGSDNVVDVKAFSAYSKGIEHAVSAQADTAIVRASTDVASISSITMDETGALSVIQGADSLDATFSEVRGAAGAPPLIPVDSVEVAQVRTTSNTAAPITASEIYQNIGQHTESAAFPIWATNNIGLGKNAEDSAQVNAFVEMNAAMPLIHTGGEPKRVYAQYYEPTFADLPKTLDFVPAEKSHSISTSEYYGGSSSSSSESLGQSSFTALLNDGINDAEVSAKNTIATFKFFQDRNKPAYILQQGIVGLARSFAVADQVQATMTVTSETESAEFAS